MKRILILAYSDLNHDARVARQVNFLSERYQLTIACFDAPKSEKHELFHIKRIKPSLFQKLIGSIFLLTGLFELAYKVIYDFPVLRKQLKSRNFDIIIANDIESLPLAFKIKKKEKILFDAHEFAPRHFEDKLVWRIFFQRFNKYLCKKYLPRIDLMITVGTGLAKEYANHYPVKPVVVTNANYYINLTPTPVDEKKIRLIHHGAANPSRQLEIMIDMMEYLDERFTLDLMLLTPTIANKKTRGYLDSLKALIKDNPRIKIIPPVKSSEVVSFIHSYDMGVFLLPPINFNYANTLPNKLFDFIQARLAIAIGPTPEMASLVNTYNLGVVSNAFSPQSLAEKLNSLTVEEISFCKSQSDKHAKELSAEKNKIILNDLVLNLLKES
jgi:hypothetical protein